MDDFDNEIRLNDALVNIEHQRVDIYQTVKAKVTPSVLTKEEQDDVLGIIDRLLVSAFRPPLKEVNDGLCLCQARLLVANRGPICNRGSL